MSVRPSQLACIALLATLLAPTAQAKPAAVRESAQAGVAPATTSRRPQPARTKATTGERPTSRQDRQAKATTAERPASRQEQAKATTERTASRPDRSAAGAPARTPGAKDMSQRTSEPAAATRGRPVARNMGKKTGHRPARRAAAPADSLAAALAAPTPAPTPAASPAASGCASGLTAAPTLQFERTRATLREFSWADMARFFETSLDEAEPEPIQVAGPHMLAADEAIRRSGLPARVLEPVARAQAVDLLTERDLTRVAKALDRATPAAIGWLLRADSPTLRAQVWTWLATTPAGVCTLARLDGREVDAAIRDRSVAVEHGEDLVFRPLGDYALAARARLAAADPQAFDALLRALWVEPDVDPRVRALVAGLRVRRGHADSIELGLRDPTAAVRGATAAAAIDRDRVRYEERVLDHAADDPADLVTELIVGELLGGADKVPQGPLAARRDERVATALARWRGHGDPLAPLPTPAHALRFSAPKFEAAPPASPPTMIAHVPPSPPPAPAPAPESAPVMATSAPAPEPSAPAPVVPEAPPAVDEAPADPRPIAHTPTPTKREPEPGPRLPSVLDDPADGVMRP